MATTGTSSGTISTGLHSMGIGTSQHTSGITMEDINNINAWESSITRHLKKKATSTVTIPKVPERIRRGEKDAYEPQIISFGPYHHGEPRLQAMEKYKWSFLEVILSFRPQIPWERYKEAIKEEEAKIRTFYADDFDIHSEEFVEMMLIDGCFLVGFLLQIYHSIPDELDSIVCMHNLIRYDILLLENQLPFFILVKIFDLLEFTPTSSPSSFMVLANHYLNVLVEDKIDNFQPPESVHHLLHLYHSRRLYTPHAGEGSHIPIHRKQSDPIRQPPSVTVLHEAGVKFEKKEVKGSSRLDVTFDVTNGKMMIPPLVIYTDSMSRLRNLVAFEQFHPNFDELNKSFTAYVEFMDFIVNTPADVALLHKEGIICHYLGSDENAAIFFNDLNRGVYVKPDHYLAPLYEDVYNFMRKRRHRWHAMLIHNYCNSPWAVLGIVVGGILLVFTLLQTIFSGISTFQLSPPSSKSH